MEYSELIALMMKRRSIRHFLSHPVSPDLIDKLMEAARWAPSAGNRQSFRFLVIRSVETIQSMFETVQAEIERIEPSLREDLREEALDYFENFTHFAQAPVVLAPIYRHGFSLYSAADPSTQHNPSSGEEALSSVSAAIMQILLAAETLGLGACWMTGPLVARSPIERLLNVPSGWKLAALIPVGYPDENPEPPKRRKIEKLLQYEKF